MDEKNKVRFEEYGIEFKEDDFEDLSNEELKKCKKIIEDIKKSIEE